MIKYTADISTLKTNLKKYSSAARVNKSVLFALSKVALKIRSDVIPKTPRGLGGLVNSWRIEKGFSNDIEVGFDIIYAAYQERGMRFKGDRVIVNRPAGGETRFLGNAIDENLESYFALFEETFLKHLFN